MGKSRKRKTSQEDQRRVGEKKTKAAPLFDGASDDEEDPARMESQHLLATSKVPGNQHKSYMESFTAIVDEYRSLLQGIIDREAQAATKQSAANHTKTLSILAQGLSQPKNHLTASTRTPSADANPSLHPTCGAANSLLDALGQIIAKYDDLSHNRMFEETALHLGQGLEVDRTDLLTLFEAQRKRTEIDIHNLLQDQAVQKEGVVSKEQDEFWTAYVAARNKRGAAGTEGDSAVGWAVAARQLKRSIAHVVRALPFEE